MFVNWMKWTLNLFCSLSNENVSLYPEPPKRYPRRPRNAKFLRYSPTLMEMCNVIKSRVIFCSSFSNFFCFSKTIKEKFNNLLCIRNNKQIKPPTEFSCLETLHKWRSRSFESIFMIFVRLLIIFDDCRKRLLSKISENVNFTKITSWSNSLANFWLLTPFPVK